MKFEYTNNLYCKETVALAIIAVVIGVAFSANGYRELGLGVGLIGEAMAFLLNMFSISHSHFIFEIEERFLKVTYRKKVVDFLWSDVENVNEDKRGLTIKLSRNGIEFPILNDMTGYQEFKTQITKKACQFGFSVQYI